MGKQRKEKVEELIKQEISKLLLNGIKDPRIGFVTVAACEMTAYDGCLHGVGFYRSAGTTLRITIFKIAVFEIGCCIQRIACRKFRITAAVSSIVNRLIILPDIMENSSALGNTGITDAVIKISVCNDKFLCCGPDRTAASFIFFVTGRTVGECAMIYV